MIGFAEEGSSRTGDPFHQVNHVSHGILDRAAALSMIGVIDFAIGRPESREVLTADCGGRAHRAKFTTVQKRLGGSGFVPAVINVGDVADATARLMRGLELVDPIEGKGKRLFEEAVTSRSEDFGADRDMTGSGGADDDGSAGWIGHRLLPIGGGLHLIFLRHIGEDRRTGIAGDDVAAASFFEVAQVAFADAAAADDQNGGKITHRENVQRFGKE